MWSHFSTKINSEFCLSNPTKDFMSFVHCVEGKKTGRHPCRSHAYLTLLQLQKHTARHRRQITDVQNCLQSLFIFPTDNRPRGFTPRVEQVKLNKHQHKLTQKVINPAVKTGLDWSDLSLPLTRPQAVDSSRLLLWTHSFRLLQNVQHCSTEKSSMHFPVHWLAACASMSHITKMLNLTTDGSWVDVSGTIRNHLQHINKVVLNLRRVTWREKVGRTQIPPQTTPDGSRLLTPYVPHGTRRSR